MRKTLWLTHAACIAAGALVVTGFHARAESHDLPEALSSPGTPVPASPVAAQPPALPQSAATLPSAARATPAEACPSLPTEVLDRLMPHFRGDLKVQVRQVMEKNYPGVVEELGLTQTEANAIFDLAQRYQSILGSVPEPYPGMDDITGQEIERARAELTKMREAEFAAVLGARKYDKWQQYQPTLDAHKQLDVWLRNIRTNMPALNDGQTRSVVSIIAAEQRRVAGETATLGSTSGNARTQLDQEERVLAIREESNTRMLEAARAYLGAEQYTAVKETVTRLSTHERSKLQVKRTQLGNGGK